MTNRGLCVTAALLLGGVAAVVIGLVYLARQEPSWYTQSAVPAGTLRTQLSKDFTKEFFDLKSAAESEKEWGADFTQDQLNSFLAEGLCQSGLDSRLLPEQVSDPRVAFDQDLIRLGFRYGSGLWSTVVTLDLRVWLPAGEPNVVALEIESFRAGLLPVSAQSLLERIEEKAIENNIGLTWYRNNGNPVAVLRFNEDSPHTTIQFQAVQLKPGSLRVKGRTLEPAPLRSAPPAPAAPPPAPQAEARQSIPLPQ